MYKDVVWTSIECRFVVSIKIILLLNLQVIFDRFWCYYFFFALRSFFRSRQRAAFSWKSNCSDIMCENYVFFCVFPFFLSFLHTFARSEGKRKDRKDVIGEHYSAHTNLDGIIANRLLWDLHECRIYERSTNENDEICYSFIALVSIMRLHVHSPSCRYEIISENIHILWFTRSVYYTCIKRLQINNLR